jgi:hypothetical protein
MLFLGAAAQLSGDARALAVRDPLLWVVELLDLQERLRDLEVALGSSGDLRVLDLLAAHLSLCLWLVLDRSLRWLLLDSALAQHVLEGVLMADFGLHLLHIDHLPLVGHR